MPLSLYFFACFISSALVLFLFLPGLFRSSAEADRILGLVKSQRPDERHIGHRERIVGFLLSRFHSLRQRLRVKKDADLHRRFAEAGFQKSHTSELYFGSQAIGILGGMVLGSFSPVDHYFWIFAGAVVGYMAPDFWLATKQRSRRDRIRRGIPDMVDLLVVCVGAGLGLDQALLRVGEELGISHPDMSKELDRVALERQAGAPRVEAWTSMAKRARIEELTSFTNMLMETDRFGTPITKALTDFSGDLRSRRRQRAEEAAAKTKVKIVFPLVLCIFPCIFIVLLVPALISLGKGFTLIGK
jgi:tight adherence protein C